MSVIKKALLFGLLLAAAAYVTYTFRAERAPTEWKATGTPTTELNVLKRAVYYIQNNYVAPERLDFQDIITSALRALQQGLGPVMVRWDEKGVIIQVAEQTRLFPIIESIALEDLPELLGHIVDFVKANLSEDEDANLEYLLIDGVASALDPHSTFLRPKIYSEFKIGTTGNFGGIGIAIGIRDGFLTVIAPLEGTPAYREGLKAGDRIIQIKDEGTINMSLTEAVERLRGTIGTTVTMLVRRENTPDPLSFTIRRALITIDSVKAELLPKEKIALIRIKNFQEDTTSEFYRSLRKLYRQANGLEGIILDLRNNPGGLLDQAVSVADALLADGIIVTTVGLNYQLNEEDRARPNDIYESIPIVVVVNEGSASASEILAGALQVHNRALVLGNQTFGKGTVQTIYDLKDGSALKLTIAKYLAAGSEDVQSFGIIPDLAMVPIHVSEKSVDLVENEKRREHSLDKRFEKNNDNGDRKSRFRLPYLVEEKGGEDEERIAGTVKLTQDYPIRIAASILRESSAEGRTNQLNSLEQLFASLQDDQDKRLIESFSKKGIDWSPGDKVGKPKANIDFWITRDDKKISEIVAGQDIHLNLSVMNRGDGPFHRLLAVSETDNPLFSDLEFPLGKIEPGESRSYSVPLSVPATIPAQQIPLKISFVELHDRHPKPYSKPITINLADKPHFTYSWKVKGNDPIKTGKDIELQFTITNLGPGNSLDPVINLANQEGSHVFLKRGRATIERMDSGAEQDASLIIRFKKKSHLKDARLSFSIEDRTTGSILRDTLSFSEDEALHDPPMKKVQRPPQIAIELPNQPYWSEKNAYKFKGTASDDGNIKEIYVFLNFDKVFYQSNNNTDSKETPFSVKVPLKSGANRITVVAKDKADLASRQQWIVWKPED